MREMSFALEESDQAAEHLANELAASQVALTSFHCPIRRRSCTCTCLSRTVIMGSPIYLGMTVLYLTHSLAQCCQIESAVYAVRGSKHAQGSARKQRERDKAQAQVLAAMLG